MSQAGAPRSPRPAEGLPEEGRAIVAAVDGSAASLDALRQAATVAAALHLRLQVVFVQDEQLLRLGAMPFSREVGAYTAAIRTLERAELEREMLVVAQRVQRAAARVAAQRALVWRFDIRQGIVAHEVAAAAHGAVLLCVGRVGKLAGRLGSTTMQLMALFQAPLLVASTRQNEPPLPLTLLDTGSAAMERVWALAARLAAASVTSGTRGQALKVLALSEATPAARARAARAEELGLEVAMSTVAANSVGFELQNTPGPVLMPAGFTALSLLGSRFPSGTVLFVP